MRELGRSLRNVNDPDPHTAPGEPPRDIAAIVAVVPPADQHHNPTPIGSTEHADCVTGERRPGPGDQFLHRLRGIVIDDIHLGGRDNRHQSTSTDSTSSNWVESGTLPDLASPLRHARLTPTGRNSLTDGDDLGLRHGARMGHAQFETNDAEFPGKCHRPSGKVDTGSTLG